MELEPGGRDLEVNKLNVYRYVQLVKQFTYGDYLNQIRARFMDGFSTIFQPGVIHMLNAQEFQRMVIGDEVTITMEELKSSVEISHGYTAGSEQIGMLFEIIVELSNDDRSLFVKFVTGAERLPIGGLAALQPRLTVARRVGEDGEVPDATLPSVMTCTNYLKLPPYSGKAVMHEKLLVAIREGQEGFLLT
jgi:E3 ubiquitin-protein ligase TRIP12